MMARSLFASLLSLVLITGTAMAQANGVSIRWDQCSRDGGVEDRVFACNRNTGINKLVLSFASAAPIASVSGCEVTLEVFAVSASLPAWWTFLNTGSCRQTSLQLNPQVAPEAANCLDTWQSSAAGGVAAYNIGFYGANTARIRAVVAVPVSFLGSVAPDDENFIMNLTINDARSTGVGSCEGCLTPVCMFFSTAKVTTPVAANDVTLTTPAFNDDSQWVTWQDGQPTARVPFTCARGSFHSAHGAPR
jgi:hypothetical protein